MARNPSSKIDLRAAKADYDNLVPAASRLRDCLVEQFSTLVLRNDIALGVPLEARIKAWASVREKFVRQSTKRCLGDITDIVGMRAILLFKRDISVVDKLLKDNFQILSVEDTGTRLDATQFGYQSQHYTLKILPSWLEVPSYSGLGEIVAEIQVRTLAQHMWAAVSHKLQYKREESVPPPLRRTIHRVSALLETVDLEFSRVLDERSTYLSTNPEAASETQELNVDLVRAILDEMLPSANRDDENNDSYDKLLINLSDFGITTTNKLRTLIGKRRKEALESDRKRVEEVSDSDDLPGWADRNRIDRGVFYTHVGLAREALIFEFGSDRVRDSVIKTMNVND